MVWILLFAFIRSLFLNDIISKKWDYIARWHHHLSCALLNVYSEYQIKSNFFLQKQTKFNKLKTTNWKISIVTMSVGPPTPTMKSRVRDRRWNNHSGCLGMFTGKHADIEYWFKTFATTSQEIFKHFLGLYQIYRVTVQKYSHILDVVYFCTYFTLSL